MAAARLNPAIDLFMDLRNKNKSKKPLNAVALLKKKLFRFEFSAVNLVSC